ncbi:hypothetical protein NJNGDCLN_03079 [Mannheimia haemolytica]
MLERGYVYLSGKAYGWCQSKKINTECPTALIVSLSNEIFEATGGDIC